MYKVLYYDIYAKYYQSIKQYQQASAYIDTTLTMLKERFHQRLCRTIAETG